jgi:hypothetical protein
VNTKKRLSKLESGSNAAPDHSHLIRLLGMSDGWSWPTRHTSSRNYSAQQAARREILEKGIAYSPSEGGADARQRDHRLREAMVQAGWCDSLQGGRLSLTVQGDTIGRAIVLQRGLTDPVVKLAFALLQTLPEDRPGKFISERTLFSLEPGQRDTAEWHEESEWMLPLIAFGFIDVTSSTNAEIFYRAVADDLPEVEPIAMEYDSDLCQLYSDEFSGVIKKRNAMSRCSNEVFIAMPGSR